MTRVGGGALVRRVLVGLLWLGGLVGVLGEIEEFSTSRDSRELYLIKSFGFNRGGFAALEVDNFVMFVPSHALRDASSSELGNSVALILRHKSFDDDFAEMDDEHIEYALSLRCTSDGVSPLADEEVFTFSERQLWAHQVWTRNITEYGLYTLFFINCAEQEYGVSVSFDLRLLFYNVEKDGFRRNYLSYGDDYLPFVYFSTALLAGTALGVWLHFLFSHRAVVSNVHHLMSLMLLLKAVEAYLHGSYYREMRRTGQAVMTRGPFLLVQFAFSLLMITVLCLLATGWSYLKPQLSQLDKQILAATAMVRGLTAFIGVLVATTHRAQPDYHSLSSLHNIFDFVSVIGIFIVIGKTRSFIVREGDQLDRRFRRLNMLRVRWFFRMFAIYVYVTRIFLHILLSLLPPFTEWFPLFLREVVEIATLSGIFYIYRKPHFYRGHAALDGQGNTYSDAEDEDEDDSDSREGDVEMAAMKQRIPPSHSMSRNRLASKSPPADTPSTEGEVGPASPRDSGEPG